MNTQVTILVRTIDRPKLLERALASIQHQTYPHWKVLLLNMGPRSVDFVDSRVEEIRSSLLNLPQALNYGFKQATTPYLTVLDDDDTWEPTFLEETLQFLTSHKVQGVATHSTKIVEGKKPYPFPVQPTTITLPQLLKQNLFTVHSFVYERSCFETLGGYDETLEVLEDWDFNLRFALHFSIGVIPKRLTNYHFHKKGQHLGEVENKEALLYTFIDHLLKRDLQTQQFGVGNLLYQTHLPKTYASTFSKALKKIWSRWME